MIRKILWLLAIFLLAHVQLVAAQHPAKNARIGFLFFGSKDQPQVLQRAKTAAKALGIQLRPHEARSREDIAPRAYSSNFSRTHF